MGQQKMKLYSVEFKERAVKLAVESDQPIAQTARDLGINENTLHTWISKYHQGANGSQGRLDAAHLYEELKRLKKENALLKEERDILKNGVAAPTRHLRLQKLRSVGVSGNLKLLFNGRVERVGETRSVFFPDP